MLSVAEALRASDLVAVSEDGFQVRRATALADISEVSKAVDSRRSGLGLGLHTGCLAKGRRGSALLIVCSTSIALVWRGLNTTVV